MGKKERIAVVGTKKDFEKKYSGTDYIPVTHREDMLGQKFDDIIKNYGHLGRVVDEYKYSFYKNLYEECIARLHK